MSNETDYHLLQVGEVLLNARRQDHYVNATELCKLASPKAKRFSDWNDQRNEGNMAVKRAFNDTMYRRLILEEEEDFREKLFISLLTNENPMNFQGRQAVEFPTTSRLPNNPNNEVVTTHSNSGNLGTAGAAATVSTSGAAQAALAIEEEENDVWLEDELIVKGQHFPADMVKQRIGELSIILGVGSGRPTWVHPYLAIQIAQWASPEFSIQVCIWVNSVIHGERQRRETQRHLERINELERRVVQLGESSMVERASLIRAEEDRARSNAVLVSVIPRLVHSVPVEFDEIIGIVKISPGHYRIYHRQKVSATSAQEEGEHIGDAYEVPSGLKASRIIRSKGRGRKVNKVPEVPSYNFFMVSKQIYFGQYYTEEDLIDVVEGVVDLVRREFLGEITIGNYEEQDENE